MDHDLQPAAPWDHGLVGRPWRAAHDVGLRGLDAQRQRRKAVGDEIQPEDLDRRQRGRPAGHGGEEHEEHLPGVAGEEIVHELLDVVVDAAAFLDRDHDRGEVVVGEHHVGRLAGDVGAGTPHRDPDVGGFDRRGVVDAVAGHRHHVAERLERLHDPQLVLGRDAGIDPGRRRHAAERRVVAAIDRGARDHAVGPLHEPQLPPHGERRCRVIPRDHHRPDAGGTAAVDGGPRLVAGRIDHADEPHVHEPALERRRIAGERFVAGHLSPGDREHPQGPVGEPGRGGEDLPSPFGGEGHHHAVSLLEAAGGEHRLRRPLRGQQSSGVGLHDHAHPLADGVEGEFQDHRLGGIGRGHSPLRSRREQRPLRGIAHHRPDALGRRAERGGRAASGRPEQPPDIRIGAGSRGAVRGQNLPLGPVADAAHAEAASGSHELTHGHLVAGEGAGLVGADHRHRAERLDARKPPHEGVASHHPLDAEGQYERHHGRQPLGHRGHREAHRPQQDIGEASRPHEFGPAAAADEFHGEDQAHEPEADRDQHAAQGGEPPLQGRRLRRRPLEEPGDVAHLGAHARGDHEPGAVAGRDHGGRVDHRDPITEGGIASHRAVGMLLHGDALAGQRRLLHRHPEGFDEPRVGRHAVARLQFHAVARHEVAGSDRSQDAAANHPRRRGGHPLQGTQRPLRPVLLQKPDDRVDQHDRHDRGRIGPVAHGRGDPGGHQQDPDHQLAKLPQEGPPPGRQGRLVEGVGAERH